MLLIHGADALFLMHLVNAATTPSSPVYHMAHVTFCRQTSTTMPAPALESPDGSSLVIASNTALTRKKSFWTPSPMNVSSEMQVSSHNHTHMLHLSTNMCPHHRPPPLLSLATVKYGMQRGYHHNSSSFSA